MIKWIKQHIKTVVVGPISVTVNEEKDLPVFGGFKKWGEVKGVVAGASRTRIKLEKHPSTSPSEWGSASTALVLPIGERRKYITFGYRTTELKEPFEGHF